jgi:predicted dehydrogenase
LFTIVGSGFGLYGYLPALIESFAQAVVLPEKYRSTVEGRPELQRYQSAIHWVSTPRLACASATGLVIATKPTEQPEIVARSCSFPNIATLVLEKPLAATPATAADLLIQLRACGKRYRIGYSFLYARWAATLDLRQAAGREAWIEWKFMAHHFARGIAGWKRRHMEGGGVIRFFGIHLLALLASQGYRTVVRSVVFGQVDGEPERWEAMLTGPGLPDCHVDVDSRSSAACFRVVVESTPSDRILVDLQEPFELEEAHGRREADRRVGVLMRLLDSLRASDESYQLIYAATNELWRQAEALNSVMARSDSQR